MIRAYDKVYLEDAMRNLGEAFDYVSSHLKIALDEFLDLFVASGIAEQFGRGVPKFVSGLSGIELAMEVLTKAGKDLAFPESDVKYSFSSEYWCGWILAYYQWHSSPIAIGYHHPPQHMGTQMNTAHTTLPNNQQNPYLTPIRYANRAKPLAYSLSCTSIPDGHS